MRVFSIRWAMISLRAMLLLAGRELPQGAVDGDLGIAWPLTVAALPVGRTSGLPAGDTGMSDAAPGARWAARPPHRRAGSAASRPAEWAALPRRPRKSRAENQGRRPAGELAHRVLLTGVPSPSWGLPAAEGVIPRCAT